jgi:hypothetical protein
MRRTQRGCGCSQAIRIPRRRCGGSRAKRGGCSRTPRRGCGQAVLSRPAHHEIGLPLRAFGTAQQMRAIDDGHLGAVLSALGGDIGLGAVIAALASYDQLNMRGERLAER